MPHEIISKIKADSQITTGISPGVASSVWRTDRIYHPSTYLTVATGVAFRAAFHKRDLDDCCLHDTAHFYVNALFSIAGSQESFYQAGEFDREWSD